MGVFIEKLQFNLKRNENNKLLINTVRYSITELRVSKTKRVISYTNSIIYPIIYEVSTAINPKCKWEPSKIQ